MPGIPLPGQEVRLIVHETKTRRDGSRYYHEVERTGTIIKNTPDGAGCVLVRVNGEDLRINYHWLLLD